MPDFASDLDNEGRGHSELGRPPWPADGGVSPAFRPFPADAVDGSIPDRLRAMADEFGTSVALRGPAGSLDFQTLWGRSLAIAARIHAEVDDTADDSDDPAPVAVLMAHDTPLVVALCGVLTSGHPAVILDPQAPEGLTRALLEGSGASLVLCDAEQRARADDLVRGQIVLDATDLGTAAGAAPPIDPGAPALLAYTSGTSGAPKAAVVSHRQLLHLVRGATDTLAISPDDRLPMLFPLSLAVAAYPLFLPILNGGTLCTFDLRSEGLAGVPGWLADEGITVVYLAPTVLRFLEGAVGDTTFPDLRLVVLGGERVDPSDVALARTMFGEDLVVANGYGTTETGVLTFWFDDRAGDPEDALPAGHPIPGMDLLVTRPDGRAAAVGEAGEIAVRSPYLFSGYWGRPDLDAQVLSIDPDDGTPVYRTGDVGRLAADGWLTLTGRVDTQVKVRGQRVVLGEVEEALLALDELSDAAVVPRFTRPGSAELVAHVVVAPERRATTDELRRRLSDDLPPAMVPSAFVTHGALPQLPNGKLDRKALEEPGGERPALRTEFVLPADPLEEELTGLWEDLLGVAPVGADDDFFDLGGNSLLGAQMLLRLEDELGHRLPMAVLLNARTVAEVAAAVRAAEQDTGRPSVLVEMQAGDPDRPTLYVTHDLQGSAFRFRHLAAALGSDQPVFGFESPFLTGEPPEFTRIDTLALRYVADLQRHQPHGPYHLCGYSFGGVLAFEMARHLRTEGEEVALLAVVDVGPGYRGVGYSRKRPPPYPTFGQRSLLNRVGLDRRVLPWVWRADLRRRGRVRPRHRLWWAWHQHWDLVGPDWDARPYDGTVHLFWGSETAATDPTQGWGRFVADVEVIRLPVDHDWIMDEGLVDHLAEPLRDLIDRTL